MLAHSRAIIAFVDGRSKIRGVSVHAYFYVKHVYMYAFVCVRVRASVCMLCMCTCACVRACARACVLSSGHKETKLSPGVRYVLACDYGNQTYTTDLLP